MSKRGRGDQLTGGSGDVNPQTLVMTSAIMTANDTLFSAATNLPIPRLPVRKGKSLVIEILKIFFYQKVIYVANTTTWITSCSTTNPSASDANGAGTGLGLFLDPRTIASHTTQTLALQATAASIAIETVKTQKEIDMTDSQGHGYLVATDSLYLVVSSANTAALNEASCKFLYRFKEVDLEEYIGIVQAQQ